MIDLIASLAIDLSDQRLTSYDENQQLVRMIPVSIGKASTPTPFFESKVLTKYHSVTIRGAGRRYRAFRTRCESLPTR